MERLMTRVFHTCSAALLGGLMLFAAVPAAHAVVIGEETNGGGFVGPLFGPTTSTLYQGASDAESGFDPFGAGYDTSDGIQLPDAFSWTQAGGSQWTFLGHAGG